jgi:hypothetical protein
MYVFISLKIFFGLCPVYTILKNTTSLDQSPFSGERVGDTFSAGSLQRSNLNQWRLLSIRLGKDWEFPKICALLVSGGWTNSKNSAIQSFIHHPQNHFQSIEYFSLFTNIINVSYPCNRPWRHVGLWDLKNPTLSRQSARRCRLDCQPYAPASLYPRSIFWCSFLIDAEWTSKQWCYLLHPFLLRLGLKVECKIAWILWRVLTMLCDT